MSSDVMTTSELARYLGVPCEAVTVEYGRLTVELPFSDAAVIVAQPVSGTHRRVRAKSTLGDG